MQYDYIKVTYFDIFIQLQYYIITLLYHYISSSYYIIIFFVCWGFRYETKGKWTPKKQTCKSVYSNNALSFFLSD